jgi:acetate kinase
LSRVLVVNAGSSSLKLGVLDGDEVVGQCEIDDWDGVDTSALSHLVERVGGIDAVGHRVVHGGPTCRGPVILDAHTEAAIEALSPLAPLHQPRSLAGIRAARRVVPGIPAVACFDTAFHVTLPVAAATYAIPLAWRRMGVRRYGFHGLSHAWASARAAELLGRPIDELRLVTAHLGAGASLCAVAGGRSVDTTMGFTPLDGLVMATRSGSVDPGVLMWLQREQGLSVDEIEKGLEEESGLLGLSGTSGDMRDVEAGLDRGEETARLAYDVYIHRLRSQVGAMTASLGGLDALVFTGGVGENSARVRADVNEGHESTPVLVVACREDLQIAAETRYALR